MRKRPDGRWEGRYTAGRDPTTGKAIYKNVLAKTQKECKEKLERAIEKNGSLAKAYAQKAGQEYHISGSSRDIFQNYGGEHTLIMDELRPKTIPYHDLLRILDPFSLTDPTMAPSRYSDKAIACDLIIITTPYSPRSFYEHEFGEVFGQSERSKIDSFDQLLRRLTLVMYMNDEIIEAMTYKFFGFEFIPGTVVQNPFSAKNRPAPKVNAMDLYRDMTDGAAPLPDPPKEKEENPFRPIEPIKMEDPPTGAVENPFASIPTDGKILPTFDGT